MYLWASSLSMYHKDIAQWRVFFSSKMNEEILCHPLQSAFLPLNHQLLSCSRSSNHTLPTVPGHLRSFGRMGVDVENQITGILCLNQQKKCQPPPASYREQCFLLITNRKRECKHIVETSSAGPEPI